MTAKNERINAGLLSAYVDGELDDVTREKVERFLAEKPEELQRVHAYRELTETLYRAYAPVLEEPIPERLLEIVNKMERPEEQRNTRRPPRSRRFFPSAAAAVLLLLVGGATGWFTREHLIQVEAEQLATELFLQRAINSYALFEKKGSPWRGAGLLEDPARMGAWFKEAWELDVSPPDLEGIGLRYMGSRAFPSSRGTAGQMIYRDENDKIYAVHFQYMGRASVPGLLQAGSIPQHASGSYVQRDGLSIYYWTTESGSASYALLGTSDENDFKGIGETLFSLLQPLAVPVQE